MASFTLDSRGRTPKKKKRNIAVQSSQTLDGLGVVQLQDKDNMGSEGPVMIITVPSMKSPSEPLQGSTRVIKDHCADWHNYIDKWNGLNDKGLVLVNQIVTAKLRAQYGESAEVATMKGEGTGIEVGSQGIMGSQMPEGLEDLCAELSGIFRSMEKLVNKMATITKHLRGVCDMEKSLPGSAESQPMFKTWPVQCFWETSSRLGEMYTKELALKKAIIEDVAHANSRDVLMTYTSAWLHQPYIDDKATLFVESMLQETGHR